MPPLLVLSNYACTLTEMLFLLELRQSIFYIINVCPSVRLCVGTLLVRGLAKQADRQAGW
jgi:hypothetical protein